MKCQNSFSGKNKKNIVNLLSAEIAQREGKVDIILYTNPLYTKDLYMYQV